MGFRFYKSVRILPGLRLNFSKSGISTSIGPRGATFNFGPRGPRGTIGIPGSGLSYTQSLLSTGGGSAGGDGSQSKSGNSGCLAVGGIGVLLLALLKCASPETTPNTLSNATDAGLVTPTANAWVSAKSLRCRSDPSTAAPIKTAFSRGEQLSVLSKQADWSQIENGTDSCWVSTKFLADTAPVASASAQALLSSGEPRRRSTRSSSSASVRYHKNKRSSRVPSSGCPCAGSRVCIGPRGGRYCITSGGNKRYGV